MLIGYLLNRLQKNRKGIAMNYLGWLIIALVVLVLVVVAFIMIKGKQEGGLVFIKDLLRWG